MNIFLSEKYKNDLDYAIKQNTWLKQFEGKKILITGATGLIGSGIIDLLLRYNDTHEMNIVIFVAGRSKEKVYERFSCHFSEQYFNFVQYDALKSISLCDSVDYIIHGASNATPSDIGEFPYETIKANLVGVSNILEYANECKVVNTVFISSSEVYGQLKTIEPIEEGMYGSIDFLNPRNSYSVGKRAAENLCISFSSEYNMHVSIVRPGHIYGPTAQISDNRVGSLFAHNAAKGENLTLKSDGSQIRSYCYVIDCATAIMLVLLKGENCKAYNISNPKSIISVKELATLYAQFADVKLQFCLPTQEEAKIFNPMSNSSLCSNELMRLGWNGLFDAETGTEHTISILCEIMNRENNMEYTLEE